MFDGLRLTDCNRASASSRCRLVAADCNAAVAHVRRYF
jgi:hypothetical protein